MLTVQHLHCQLLHRLAMVIEISSYITVTIEVMFHIAMPQKMDFFEVWARKPLIPIHNEFGAPYVLKNQGGAIEVECYTLITS